VWGWSVRLSEVLPAEALNPARPLAPAGTVILALLAAPRLTCWRLPWPAVSVTWSWFGCGPFAVVTWIRGRGEHVPPTDPRAALPLCRYSVCRSGPEKTPTCTEYAPLAAPSGTCQEVENVRGWSAVNV